MDMLRAHDAGGKRQVNIVTHHPVVLRPDPSRTVVRPFEPGDPDGYGTEGRPRAERIARRVLTLDRRQLAEELGRITESFSGRTEAVEDLLLRRFAEVRDLCVKREEVSRTQALVIGGYFCEEYSFEAAALFNPSVVPHPDQSGLGNGAVRFLMSLRGIGEGHVSSVTFRTGVWAPNGEIEIDEPSRAAIPPQVERREGEGDGESIFLSCGGSRDISETVLFPFTSSQSKGIEDLRLVRFHEEDGTQAYLGTYTAFDGSIARSELLSVSDDLKHFEMHPLAGAVAATKGMALFPRKIGGRYAMLGRQDNENVWLLTSSDLYTWDGGARLIPPKYSWEFVQMGNCGAPHEIEEGWLVLTHGVGSVRNYCIGACLLDRDDPSRVLKRLPNPLIHPSPKERDGYVPNVVYSCGGLIQDRTLLLPYGVADSFTTFATVRLDDLLAAMV